MKRVYCTFCGQTFVTDPTETCSLCRKVGGLVDPGSAAAMRDVVARKQEQAPPPGVALASGVASAGQVTFVTMHIVRFILGGIFAIGLGIFLIAQPDFRSHPGRIELGDLWPGLAAIVAGLGMLGLAVYFAKRGLASPASSPGPTSDRPGAPVSDESPPSSP